MRTLLIAGTAVALLAGSDVAMAGDRVVQRGPGAMRGTWQGARPAVRPMQPIGQRGPRWGSKVGGRWWGGVNAPGGWNAYRQPVRGWALPVYWNSPRFYVSDWSTYGLSQPPYGYNWVRYYDDAVLVDARGSVYDTRGDVDWDGQSGYGASYAYDDRGYDGRGYDDRGYDDRTRVDDGRYPPVAPDDDRDRRDNGLGGAAIGAVAGGVAGNLIGGRGNRLGGTLIGAGVGAAAGYAIDKNEDRGRRAPPPPPPRGGYGADYPPPPPAGYAPGRYPVARVAPGGQWTSPDGTTTVVTSGGGYGGVTTVTVQSAPVVTTTTTEIYEDHVTWSKPARKKVWKPRRTAVCYCK